MTSTAALLAATRFERRTLNWLCNDFSSNVHFQLLQGHPLDPRFCKQVPLTWQNWHVMWATWRYSKNPSEQNLGSDMTAVTSYPVHILMNKKIMTTEFLLAYYLVSGQPHSIKLNSPFPSISSATLFDPHNESEGKLVLDRQGSKEWQNFRPVSKARRQPVLSWKSVDLIGLK